MEHSEAVHMKATEQYLLGELSIDQREAFEEHFFDCAECAVDVKAAAELLDNARAVLRETPVPARQYQPAKQAAWWAWLRPAWGLAAAAAVLAVLGYENLVTIPHLKTELAASNTPQAITSLDFASAGTRAGGETHFRIPADKPFSIYVDIPASDSFASYTAAVETSSGQQKFAVPVTLDQAKEPVQILLSAKTLPPGDYALVIRGVGVGQPTPAAAEVARYPFVVEQ